MSKLRTAALEDTAPGGISVPAKYVTQGSAKAWTQFNTVTSTTISSSFNHASLTDNGTGDTTENFTAAFSDTAFCNVPTSAHEGVVNQVSLWVAQTASTFRTIGKNSAGTAGDSGHCNTGSFGTLA